MLLVIIGLHLVLGSIWLINRGHTLPAIVCFVAGMAATHYGWRRLATRRRAPGEGEERRDG